MTSSAISATYRWVAIIMTVVAALGWGVLLVMSPSAASVQDAQRQEIDRLQQEQKRLDVVAREQSATAVELNEMASRLAATRDDLARAKEAYDLAQNAVAGKKAELGAAQASLQAAQTELGSLQQKISLARRCCLPFTPSRSAFIWARRTRIRPISASSFWTRTPRSCAAVGISGWALSI